MNLMKIDSGLKMNSIEIADLVESRHDDVKRSIDRLVQKNVIVQPPTADQQTSVTMTSLELVEYVNSFRKEKALVEGAAFPSKGHAKLEHS